MAFVHPTDPFLWLDDGATTYPAAATGPGVINTSSAVALGAANNSISWSHVVSAGDDRLLLIWLACENAVDGHYGTWSGVTYDGVALTKAKGQYTVEGVATVSAELWYLVNPPIGTATIVATANVADLVAGIHPNGHAITLQNAYQGAPDVITGVSNSTDASSFSTGLTTLRTNSLLLDFIASNREELPVPGGSQTQRTTAINTDSGNGQASVTSTRAAAAVGAFTESWTFSVAYGRIAAIVVAVAPAAVTTAYGHVGGDARLYDFGADPWRGFAAFEPSVLDLSSGNETYHLVVEGHTASDLSGDSHELASWNLRALNPQDAVTINSVYNEVHYRYGRLRIDVGGTTPAIKLKAFLKTLGSIIEADRPSQSDLITSTYNLLDNLSNAGKNLRDWATGPIGGGIFGNGTFPLTDGSGNTLYAPSIRQMMANMAPRSPFEYGAIGDGTSHPASEFYATLTDLKVDFPFASSLWQEMDFLAWQKALYAGGLISVQPHLFMMQNSHVESQTPLICISGTFWAPVHGSRFLNPHMIEQTDDTQYLINYNFANSSAWSNATIFASTDILMTTFGGGFATMTDTGNPGTGQRTYFNCGQQVTLQPGRYTMSATCEATLGASYYLVPPNIDPGYANIGFSAISPGEGGNPIGKASGGRFNLSPDNLTETRLFTTDFQIDEPITLWAIMEAGGAVSVKWSEFSIKKWLPNCAILATRDGSPDHFPIPSGFDGLWLIGPDTFTMNGKTGVRYISFKNVDGNIVRFTNSMISDFGRGVSFGHGAYLPEFDNLNIYYCGTGVYTELGTENAGENLRFKGGGIANCVVGIDNQAGFEITLVTTALDYCYQVVINNNGRIELQSVHVETWAPVEADKPLFHLASGQVTMFGGMLLFRSDITLASQCAPISSDFSTATFETFGVEPYNVSSDPNGAGKGAMISGPGQFITHGWRNRGNPNIGPLVVSYAPVMDVLGGAGKFPEPNIYTRDPTGILLEGGAFPDKPPQVPFTASIAGSKLTISDIGALVHVAEGMQIRAPGIKGVPLVSFIPGGATGGAGDYLISIPQNVASRAMTGGYDGQIDRWSTIYGTLEWTDAYAADGSNCIKFTKGTSATGLNSVLHFLVPVTPRATVLGFVDFLFPINYSPVDPAETVELYFQLYWVRSLGPDEYGRPIIVRELFAGYKNLYGPRAGSDDPQRCYLSTTYSVTSSDPATESSTHSPEWANYLDIRIGTQALPDSQVFYMRNMLANILR